MLSKQEIARCNSFSDFIQLCNTKCPLEQTGNPAVFIRTKQENSCDILSVDIYAGQTLAIEIKVNVVFDTVAGRVHHPTYGMTISGTTTAPTYSVANGWLRLREYLVQHLFKAA